MQFYADSRVVGSLSSNDCTRTIGGCNPQFNVQQPFVTLKLTYTDNSAQTLAFPKLHRIAILILSAPGEVSCRFLRNLARYNNDQGVKAKIIVNCFPQPVSYMSWLSKTPSEGSAWTHLPSGPLGILISIQTWSVKSRTYRACAAKREGNHKAKEHTHERNDSRNDATLTICIYI